MPVRILVHGHRGARAVLPENTIPAFEYAIDQGADAIEMDVHLTKDDIPVISHDPVLNPRICQGPGNPDLIRRLSFAELREWDCGALVNPQFPRQKPVPGAHMPSLDEVLALAGRGNFWFNIEVKMYRPEHDPAPDHFVRRLLDCIDRHDLRPRVIIQSFDFRVLIAMKQLASDIRLAALYEEERLGDFVSVARTAGAAIIAPQYPMVTAARVAAAHDAGIPVIPWTANTPDAWSALVAAGVDAIITDDPAALIAYLQERNLR